MEGKGTMDPDALGPRGCRLDQAGRSLRCLVADPSGVWCVQLQGGGGRQRGALTTDDNAADVRARPRDPGKIQTTPPSSWPEVEPWTPAHQAVEINEYETLSILLDSGADPDEVCFGHTLLTHAIGLEGATCRRTTR